jgi:CRP-like cAMP-binding protein
MVSTEQLESYPFFEGLDHEYLLKLVEHAEELSIDADKYIFREGDEIRKLYLITEGTTAIVFEIPDTTSDDKTTDMAINTIGTCDLFGFSALVPPHKTNVSAKTLTPCQMIAFDGRDLLVSFDDDCRFGFKMMQRVALVMRERISEMQAVSLAYINE